MHIENMKLSFEWKPVDSANTGDSFLIQNTSPFNVEYVVSESAPTDTKGGIILPYQQLSFKKVTGNLYVKKNDGRDGYISIEQIEEA